MIAERLEKARIPGRLGRGAATGGRWRRHPRPFCPFSGGGRPCEKTWRKSSKIPCPRKTGYVPPQWCTIKQAIDVIHHSGGKAVIAHPGRYDLSAKWLKRCWPTLASRAVMPWKWPSVSRAPHERASWPPWPCSLVFWRRRDPIFISPARGSNFGRKLWLPAGVEGVWHSWEAAAE